MTAAPAFFGGSYSGEAELDWAQGILALAVALCGCLLPLCIVIHFDLQGARQPGYSVVAELNVCGRLRGHMLQGALVMAGVSFFLAFLVPSFASLIEWDVRQCIIPMVLIWTLFGDLLTRLAHLKKVAFHRTKSSAENSTCLRALARVAHVAGQVAMTVIGILILVLKSCAENSSTDCNCIRTFDFDAVDPDMQVEIMHEAEALLKACREMNDTLQELWRERELLVAEATELGGADLVTKCLSSLPKSALAADSMTLQNAEGTADSMTLQNAEGMADLSNALEAVMSICVGPEDKGQRQHIEMWLTNSGLFAAELLQQVDLLSQSVQKLRMEQ